MYLTRVRGSMLERHTECHTECSYTSEWHVSDESDSSYVI